MKKIFIFLLFCSVVGYSQKFEEKNKFKVDVQKLKDQLNNSKNRISNSPLSISIPVFESSEVFNLTSIPVSKNLPEGTFTLSGKSDNKQYPIKVTISDLGINGLFKTESGYYFFESLEGSPDSLILYQNSEKSVPECFANDIKQLSSLNINLKNDNLRLASISPFPVGSNLRVYEMAAAATGEMTSALGSKTNAVNKIVSIINAANLIYESELAISFQLIPETTTSQSLIFTNPNSDPFATITSFPDAYEAQKGFDALNSNNTLSYSKYDVGHVFNISSFCYACGVAGGQPCVDPIKSYGMTQFQSYSILSPIVYIFVHEMAHQFGAEHTYNASGGSTSNPTFCTVGWSSSSAYEPGSGSTLMAYNNNCSSPTNYVLLGNNTDTYFHTKSLESIFSTVNGYSGTCNSLVSSGNTPPVANAGPNYTIPKRTPFKLSGTATDVNTADVLTYVWEEYDKATSNDRGALGSGIAGVGGYTAVNSTSAPLFRSYEPSTNPIRVFPALEYILNEANMPLDNIGEALPNVGRTMKFRFTVRDNNGNAGGIDSDEAVVYVSNYGPFEITSQNSSELWVYNGTNTATINWSVNSTNLSPINCSNVKISLSTDGGYTFPIVLASSTPNDGNFSFVIPNNITNKGRVKIEAIGNIFFDINNKDIIIDNSCSPSLSTILPDTYLNFNQNNDTLQFSLLAKGDSITSINGQINSFDYETDFILSSSSNCYAYSNTTKYEVYNFQVLKDTTYVFTATSDNYYFTMNLYSIDYNKYDYCQNWLASSTYNTSPYITFSKTISLFLPKGDYALQMNNVKDYLGNVPSNYSISINNPIFHLLPIENSPYRYTFIVINSITNTIVECSANPNLKLYPKGDYEIYGFSYYGLNLSGLVNSSFSNLQTNIQNGALCGTLSSNFKRVKIIDNCPSSISLVSPSDDVPNGIMKNEVSNTITAENTINDGNVTYDAGKSITLNPGFISKRGVVFKAYIDGCGNN